MDFRAPYIVPSPDEVRSRLWLPDSDFAVMAPRPQPSNFDPLQGL